jgi:hypothetical protein
MTVIERPLITPYTAVTLDLYRDIHKGTRSELFAVTETAGNVDPSDREARAAFAAHVRDVFQLLAEHAEHEDAAVQPAVDAHLPVVAAQIAEDHEWFERRMVRLQELVDDTVDATRGVQREYMQYAYLELASFTSAYLAHQDVEERVVMPALEQAIGVEGVGAIHDAIIASIPPDQMARSLAVMLPAMNIDDRAELLAGMQANAPADVFAGVWGLTGTVLNPPDYTALGTRLGV